MLQRFRRALSSDPGLWVIVSVFAITRAIALLMGMRYVKTEVAKFMQFVDLDVLQHHLLRALWNLHSQPPLLNAVVGVALKLGGLQHLGFIMATLQITISLLAYLAIYLVLRTFEVGPKWAVAAVLLMVLNPSAIEFEFDALYTVWVSSLNCFAALALARFLRFRRTETLAVFFSLLALMTLLRSLYQWVWIAALLVLLAVLLKRDRRRILIWGVAGLSLPLLWCGKNYVEFGHFETSTWGPFSMAKHWKSEIGRRPVADWTAEGRLPALEAMAHGQEAGSEQDKAAITPRGVPELDSLTKSGGWPNANSLATLRMYDELGKEDRFLLRHYPVAFARQAGSALIAYFRPTTEYFGLDFQTPEELTQHSLAAPVWRPVERICCMSSTSPYTERRFVSARASLMKVKGDCLSAVILNLLLGIILYSVLRGKLRTLDRNLRVFIVALALTILYSFTVSTLLENGENMRFRYETQALVVVIVTLGLWNWNLLRTPQSEHQSHLPIPPR